MKVELIACSRPLSGQCGINKSLSVAACMFSKIGRASCRERVFRAV